MKNGFCFSISLRNYHDKEIAIIHICCFNFTRQITPFVVFSFTSISSLHTLIILFIALMGKNPSISLYFCYFAYFLLALLLI